MRPGTILSYSYFVHTRPQAWEGITNKYCNIYFVIPIHWGRKFIFSSVMGSGKVISSLAFVSEAFAHWMGCLPYTVTVSHALWVRIGVNGDRVWISSMEQSGNMKMIYLYWNYLTLLILIWPINNINVNNREEPIPPNPSRRYDRANGSQEIIIYRSGCPSRVEEE